MRIFNFEQTGMEKVEDFLIKYKGHSVNVATLREILKSCNIAFVLEDINRVQSTLICELDDSYVQQSQRYVTMGADGFIAPKFKNRQLKARSKELIEKAFSLYERMTELKDGVIAKGRPKQENYKYGIPIEDARYILPLAATTNISISMSGNKLIEFFGLLTDPDSGMENILLEIKKYIPQKLYDILLIMYRGPVRLNTTYPNAVDAFYASYFDTLSKGNKMILISSFIDPDVRVGLGAITSTSAKPPSSVLKEWGKAAREKAIGTESRVLGYGHVGISEQARTTFALMCSLVTYHQLIRHRLVVMHTEGLMNVIGQHDREFIIPDSIRNSEFISEYIELVDEFRRFRIEALRYDSIELESLESMLVNCEQIKMVASTNARIDCLMLKDRTCFTAQWEIRQLSLLKLEMLRKLSPILYEDSLPPCINGVCKEGALTCGKADQVRKYWKK